MVKRKNGKNPILLEDLLMNGSQLAKDIANKKDVSYLQNKYFYWSAEIKFFLDENGKVSPAVKSYFYQPDEVPFARALMDISQYTGLMNQEVKTKMEYLRGIAFDRGSHWKREDFELYEEGGKGFIKFGSKKPIIIGEINGRPFKLLSALKTSLGVFRSIDSIFASVMLEEDEDDFLLNKKTTSNNRKVELIKNAIKEIQRGGKIKGNLKFKWSKFNKEIRMEII